MGKVPRTMSVVIRRFGAWEGARTQRVAQNYKNKKQLVFSQTVFFFDLEI